MPLKARTNNATLRATRFLWGCYTVQFVARNVAKIDKIRTRFYVCNCCGQHCKKSWTMCPGLNLLNELHKLKENVTLTNQCKYEPKMLNKFLVTRPCILCKHDLILKDLVLSIMRLCCCFGLHKSEACIVFRSFAFLAASIQSHGKELYRLVLVFFVPPLFISSSLIHFVSSYSFRSPRLFTSLPPRIAPFLFTSFPPSFTTLLLFASPTAYSLRPPLIYFAPTAYSLRFRPIHLTPANLVRPPALTHFQPPRFFLAPPPPPLCLFTSPLPFIHSCLLPFHSLRHSGPLYRGLSNTPEMSRFV